MITHNKLNAYNEKLLFYRYPFDWQTPFGYLICISIQTSLIFITAEIYVCIVFLTFGFCSFIIALITELEKKLNELNENLTQFKGKKLFAKEKVVLRKKLAQIIKFHMEIRE